MIINLLSHLLPIIPKSNIHLYQDLSSMANVLPTEEGMLVSGITGTMYSSYLGCCANQINLASLSTPDTRPRYQTCGTHPCTNWAQEDLSCSVLCGNFMPEKWPGKSKTMIAGEASSYGVSGIRISSKQTWQVGQGGWSPPLIAAILKLHKHCYMVDRFPLRRLPYLVIFKPVFRRKMVCSWGLKPHI